MMIRVILMINIGVTNSSRVDQIGFAGEPEEVTMDHIRSNN